MVILITGASGFIGRRLVQALAQAGHEVIAAGRHRPPEASGYVAADFTRDLSPEVWLGRLSGVDAVINAVGILRETRQQSFATIHTQAPKALFEACVAAKVQRVVQISALGADDGQTRYFHSKRAADDVLMSLPLDWTVVRPALVFGPGGASARLFTLLASLPILPMPGRGDQLVQPIHADDLIEAIVTICTQPIAIRAVVPLVGPRAMTFKELLTTLRASLGLKAAPTPQVPMSLMRLAAWAGAIAPRALLDKDTLAMLMAGNVADPQATARVLKRPPRSVESFVPSNVRTSVARVAQLHWLLPIIRWSIALVWIWSGVVSLGLYPREESLQLLARVGVPAALAPLMLYGAAALDLMLGVATLAMRRRQWLWLTQIGLILAYSIIVTLKLPEFWLHPYGPILKNLPMLAVLYALYVLEKPQWNT